jgi:hypothetical protein
MLALFQVVVILLLPMLYSLELIVASSLTFLPSQTRQAYETPTR